MMQQIMDVLKKQKLAVRTVLIETKTFFISELRPRDDMKMVMACALFNDSLESDCDDSLQGNPPVLLAQFRKTLGSVAFSNGYGVLSTISPC
jgi:hypothetical protein